MNRVPILWRPFLSAGIPTSAQASSSRFAAIVSQVPISSRAISQREASKVIRSIVILLEFILCVCDMNMWADYIHNWHETFVWHPITCWIENGFSSGKAHYKLGRLDHSVCVYRCAFMPVTQKCWRVSKIKPLHHLFQMVSFNSTKFIQNPWVIRLLKPWTLLAVLGALVRQRCYGVGIHGKVNGAPLIQQRHRPGREALDGGHRSHRSLRWFTDSHW